MRSHGFRYVEPKDVKVGDMIVVLTEEMGVTRKIVDARTVVEVERFVAAGSLPHGWSFDLDRDVYIVEDTCMVPIVDGSQG